MRMEDARQDYPKWLLAFERRDGVRGHYLTDSRERAQRKADANAGPGGWKAYVLYGCEAVEAWERKPGTL
ncbi:MAG: hypothetical protein IJ111_13520 [Eggerthellaceae bacterium]|nr:hypothetical protein [Eggerthellaceae bacterium]